ncbi:pentapeptide repeat-containing protein [Streptomyces sp. NPDC060048]|uniref:pentapeptide repeat-containing protein n=1 Tax=unclassified Streptomyces TaxID=2593676 RepID=UPI0036751652
MGSARWWMRAVARGLTVLSALLLVAAVLSWDRVVGLAAHIPLVPLIFVIGAVGCAVVSDQLYNRTQPERQRRFAPRIRWWWVVLAFAAVLTAVLATTALLLPQITDLQPESERSKQRIEAVRTALAAGAGVGAAITVLLALRRQQHHEEATERTEYDASERRINELYIKAVEQLGSTEAPVRLGGLYTLGRLGQAAADHRQTIVDVICAYLRMPYIPPPAWWPVSRSRQAARALFGRKADNQRHQELQVRNAAEYILLMHLHDPRPPDQREITPADYVFWDGMGVNLNHATFTYYGFGQIHVTWASFTGATFTTAASFQSATFTGFVVFDDATFTRTASFDDATFTGTASFDGTTFTGTASFDGTTFKHSASFDGVTFNSVASFADATFQQGASFAGARARLTAPDGTPLAHSWPTGWEVRPTANGWAILSET